MDGAGSDKPSAAFGEDVDGDIFILEQKLLQGGAGGVVELYVGKAEGQTLECVQVWHQVRQRHELCLGAVMGLAQRST